MTEREVLYPDFMIAICRGADAITAEVAKAVLGWTDDAALAKKEGHDFPLLKDLNGKAVYCLNNIKNRPLYPAVYEAYRQEILNRRWKFNGEPIIIGTTGIVLNGQHQLVGLVLAEQERTSKEKASHWEENWPVPCSIDKVVEYGVEETDEVVNTMDTCKPRSLSDVIFRSEHFRDLAASDRRVAATMTQSAIALLWERTGAGSDFVKKRTHSESIDFLQRHLRVLEAVRHVLGEYGSKWEVNNKRVSAGVMAGLMYLMGTSTSDANEYHASDKSGEHLLDFALWDKATEFVTLLCGSSPDFQEVRYALAELVDSDTGGESTPDERIAVLVNAWHAFANDAPLVASKLIPQFKVDREEGTREMIQPPTIGGIDLDFVEATKSPRRPKDGPKTDEHGVILPPDERDEPAPKPRASRKKADEAAADDAKKADDKAAGKVAALLQRLKARHPEKTLVFLTPDGQWAAWGIDAKAIAKVLGVKTETKFSLPHVAWSAEAHLALVDALIDQGRSVGTCGRGTWTTST